jgi:hypothetical protein
MKHNDSARVKEMKPRGRSERERERGRDEGWEGWGHALLLCFMMFGVNIHVRLRKKLEVKLQRTVIQLLLPPS